MRKISALSAISVVQPELDETNNITPDNKIIGKAWKYGDSVNTDQIFPGKYTYTLTIPDDRKEFSSHEYGPQ